VEQSQIFDALLGSVDVLAGRVPGLKRFVKHRVMLSRALGNYKTPANDHLRRALRLSWIKAATTVFDDRIAWAEEYPSATGAETLKRFVPQFDAVKKEVLDRNCKLNNQGSIGSSPIDAHLDLLIENISDPLSGRDLEADPSELFTRTLAQLTGVEADEIPSVLVQGAINGLVSSDGSSRDFAHLFADEFALVIQDPYYYREAGESFRTIQTSAIAELLREIKSELSDLAHNEPAIDADEADKVFKEVSPEWLTETLQSEFTKLNRQLGQKIDSGFSGLQGEFRELRSELRGRQLVREDVSTLQSHTPTEARTVMFAGQLAADFRFEDLFSRIRDKVSRRASRISETLGVVPMSWDFGISEKDERHDGRYAMTEAWATLNEEVVGAVLILSDTFSTTIAPDKKFLEDLDKQNWLAPRTADADVRCLFDDTLDMSARDSHEFVKNRGGLEICYETRFAIECILRGIPLVVVQLSADDDSAPALACFRQFLSVNGVECVDLSKDNRNLEWVEGFVSSFAGANESRLANPYRALDYYQVDDADAFIGRDREADFAQSDLGRALDEGQSLLLGITGPSGCGKSSFMRARVAAEAQKKHDLIPLEMRTTDFQWGDNARVSCLPKLVSKIGAILGASPPEQFVRSNAASPLVLERAAIRWFDKIVDREGEKLLICLDQFEEILDDLSEGVNESEWRALISVLRHLSKNFAWPIVFTLEDSRRQRFDEQKESLGFEGAQTLDLKDEDERFYRSLIEEPFRKSGIDLDTDIVDKLMEEVAEIRGDSTISASPLPLLSLRLYQLFRDLAPRAPKSAQETRLGDTFNRLRVTQADIADTSLALGDMMADLAETAWDMGDGGAEEDDVGKFLRPLVRISVDPDQPKNGKLVLRSLVARGYRAEQKLHDAFRRQRLLVPSGGGHRLVHEAVIRRWPKAKNWYESDRDNLILEAKMRRSAILWDEDGKPDDIDPDPNQINDAARVLVAHVRDWAMRDLSHLTTEMRLLRKFALKCFDYCQTPQETVSEDKKRGAHVHVAASYGLDELLERFIKIEPDCVHNTDKQGKQGPLASAGWFHKSTVELLLKNGAKPSNLGTDGYTDLDSAIWGEQDETLELMLKYVDPSDWDEHRANPLGGAARRCRIDIAEKLVKAGFKYDQKCKGGWTPLHQAASTDDVENFRYFLERGDLLSETDFRYTPLHVAAANGHVDIVEEILRHDAGARSIDAMDNYSRTPLMAATHTGQYEVVRFLLPYVADPGQSAAKGPYEGFGPLHFALIQYFLNGEKTTEYMRRRILAIVKAYIEDEALDVAIKAKVSPPGSSSGGSELTAWEMASGLPEVQRAIQLHRNFPMELLEKLRVAERAKRWDKLRKDLFDAAKAKNKGNFERLLGQERADAQKLDLKAKNETVETTTAALAIKNEWYSLVLAMIAAGQVDPWDSDSDSCGLYATALRSKKVDLIEVIEDRMPEFVSLKTARSVLTGLRNDPTDKIEDPDGRILDLLLGHLNKTTANELMLEVAFFGDLASISDLKSIGADGAYLDDCGRTYQDNLPDVARAELGLEPLLQTAHPNGESLFYPDAEGWSLLEDLSVVEPIDRSDDGIWDARVVWSRRKLPFYPQEDCFLLRAKHPDWSPETYLYYLLSGTNLYWLNGTSPPIHEFNAKNQTDFGKENALEYLKFFCFFVRGEDGPFYVIDGREAVYLPKSLSADEKASLHSKYKAPRVYGKDEKGHRQVGGLIYYSNACFWADFLVQPTGMVEMRDDMPLVGDLSHRVFAPITLDVDAQETKTG